MTELHRRPPSGRLRRWMRLAAARLHPPADWRGKRIVVVVSTGRTGTRFIADFFDRCAGIVGLHEPLPDFSRLGLARARGRVPAHRALRRVERGRRHVAHALDERDVHGLVEANNRLFSLLPELPEAFRGAELRVVRVVRDGREVVRSGVSRGWYRPGERHPRLRATDFPDDPWAEAWPRWDAFARSCWLWQKMDRIIAAGLEELPEGMGTTIRFEEIFAAPGAPGLMALADAVGVARPEVRALADEMLARRRNATRRHRMGAWHTWSAREREIFRSVAGAHQESLWPGSLEDQ